MKGCLAPFSVLFPRLRQKRTKAVVNLGLTTLLVVSLAGCTTDPSAYKYGLPQQSDPILCKKIGASLSYVPPPKLTSGNICNWYFEMEKISAGDLSSPKWEEFSPTETVVRDMHLIGLAYFEHLDEASLTKIWDNEYRAKWIGLQKNGALRYEQSRFDLDNDGNIDHVIREVRTQCDAGLLWPISPRPYVLVRGKIDKRYGSSGTNVINPLFIEGKTMISYVEIAMKPNDVVDGKTVTGATPPLAVKFAWPSAPTRITPFMHGDPVCSFEVL